jgi:hypothetical protein
MRDFEIGDKVKFQLISGTPFPRYNDETDGDPNGTGPWAFGVVAHLEPFAMFGVRSDDSKFTWAWRQPSATVTSIYSRPGYLCHVEESYKEEVKPKNNDGRITCAWCGANTKPVQSLLSTYNICTKCGK